MEVINEVKTIETDFQCPKCEKGFLRPTGITYLTFPQNYQHTCNNDGCGYIESFNIIYPHVSYEKVDEETEIPGEYEYFSVNARKFDWLKFMEYVNTYDPKIDAENNNRTIIHDILFGIGLSLDQENFEFHDGYKRFKKFLKEIL